MSITITGLDETIANIGDVFSYLDNQVEKAVRTGALMVEGDAIKSIQRGSKTGRIYNRGSKTHQASAPGEAPATDTGNLVSKIQAVKEISGDGWLVGTDLAYGRYLEHGTSNMKPRPWLIPALEGNRRKITLLIAKEIKGKL